MARGSLIDTLLAPRIAALLEPLPAALAGDVVAVHSARVGSRRLREVLPPMRDVLPAQPPSGPRDEVRRVTRALGPVRELDVAIGALRGTGRGARPRRRRAPAVSRSLARDREAAQRRMRAALPPRRRQRLEAALTALGGPEPADAAARLPAAVDARVARRGRRVRKALDAPGASYVPERAPPGADRGQAAALCARSGRRRRAASGRRRG